MSNTWQYVLLKSISRMVCLLPYNGILFFGKIIGKAYYHIAARQRRRALQQMQESLSIPYEEAEKKIASLFTKLGQTFLEVLYIPALTSEKMRRYVTIENRQYLVDAQAQGRGVVMLASHMGNWEWMGAALAMEGFPVSSVIKSQPNDQHTKLLNEYRQMAGIGIFTRGTTEVISAARALKQGKILGFLSDQDAGPNGLFIEFLGKMSSTPTGAAVFAKKFKTPVVPVFMVRKPEGGHRLMLYEPLYYEDTGNEVEDIYRFTVKLTTLIDATIRQYPDEWLWFQKRWNTEYRKSPVEQDSSVSQERMDRQA